VPKIFSLAVGEQLHNGGSQQTEVLAHQASGHERRHGRAMPLTEPIHFEAWADV